MREVYYDQTCPGCVARMTEHNVVLKYALSPKDFLERLALSVFIGIAVAVGWMLIDLIYAWMGATPQDVEFGYVAIAAFIGAYIGFTVEKS